MGKLPEKALPKFFKQELLMPQMEIRIEGHLDKRWMDWLEGISFTHTSQNQTLLYGSVQDQAALFGLIIKLRDLGVKLVSINFEEDPLDENLGN